MTEAHTAQDTRKYEYTPTQRSYWRMDIPSSPLFGVPFHRRSSRTSPSWRWAIWHFCHGLQGDCALGPSGYPLTLPTQSRASLPVALRIEQDSKDKVHQIPGFPTVGPCGHRALVSSCRHWSIQINHRALLQLVQVSIDTASADLGISGRAEVCSLWWERQRSSRSSFLSMIIIDCPV